MALLKEAMTKIIKNGYYNLRFEDNAFIAAILALVRENIADKKYPSKQELKKIYEENYK